MARPRSAYAGPACPHCRHVLASDALQDGDIRCPACLTEFEARVFHPPQRSARVLQLAQSGPEGATSCANHPRNAAVASCERCGLLICSLCQLDVESGKYCPSCFERLAQEGALATAKNRFRDYGSLAMVWSIVGLLFSFLFLGIPLGIVSIYYAIRALRSRQNRSSLIVVAAGIFIALVDIGLGGTILFSMLNVARHFP